MNASPNSPDPKLLDPAHRLGNFFAYLRKDCLGLNQSGFAARLGVTRFYLSNIEGGRSPLKLKTAWDSCFLFDVHPDFLISCGKHNRAPFPVMTAEAKARADALINANRLTNFVDAWAAVRDVLFTLPAPPATASSQNDEKKDLTNVVLSATRGDVQTQMQKFLERLKKATSQRGQQTALADFLGVHRVSVSKWLSGKKEPGGEITLKMLQWVEQQERQK